MKTHAQHKNIIGTSIRARRIALGWTQEKLAGELRNAGLKITRGGVAKVESRMVRIRDFNVLYFSTVLGVEVDDLFAQSNPEHAAFLRERRTERTVSAMSANP